jgi:hypothetical protein
VLLCDLDCRCGTATKRNSAPKRQRHSQIGTDPCLIITLAQINDCVSTRERYVREQCYDDRERDVMH